MNTEQTKNNKPFSLFHSPISPRLLPTHSHLDMAAATILKAKKVSKLANKKSKTESPATQTSMLGLPASPPQGQTQLTRAEYEKLCATAARIQG